jgi:hypothetical protein
MRPALLLLAATLALSAALPAAAQVRGDPRPMPSPLPTRVVSHSDRLVTARTTGGGTQSYNCASPANAKRAICRGAARRPRVLPR